jgi:hypothetical protein
MSIRVRSSLFTLVIIAVLIFSAVGPTMVYAAGGTHTDSNCSKSLESSKTSNADSKCKWTQGSGNSAHAGNETTSSPSWTQVPNNTTVTVLDSAGQSQPLITQGAADAIATTSDPIWCPAGQSPTPGANGCTQSFPSFGALLTFLSGNAAFQGAGTIYVQQGAYQGGESSIDFNNYNLSNISGADLTISGGWNPADPTTTTTSTFNNTAIVIGSSANPWGGSLTINNLALNFNPTGQSGTGITLFTQNNITISNVSVMNSANGSGAELNASGNVTIDHSNFDRNKVSGATIRAGQSVAISNSSFSNPVNGRRQNTGLDIVSDGSVSLFNVLANNNRQVGANINAAGRVTVVSSVFSGTKIIQGSNTFLGYGLQVVTPDAIDLDGVTANDNFLWGASLNAGGDVTIANSIFNANTTASPGFIDDTGLLVTSGGNVSIDNIQANDNRLIGATINAAGNVSINNSTFTGNRGTTLDSAGTPTFHGYGLQVVTTGGSIFINLVDASNNNLFGAHLEASGDVTISSNTNIVVNPQVTVTSFSNNGTGSTSAVLGRGLEVISGGNVFLDTVTLDNNQTFGANIQTANDVFLDSVTATNNGTDGVEVQGIQVQGNCPTLFLIGGTYSNNGQYGLSVINAALNQSGSPVFAGNAAGDIFQDPGTCVFTPATSPTPAVDNTGSTTGSRAVTSWNTGGYASLGNPFSSGMAVRPSTGFSTNLATVTLNSFLANTRLANGSYISLFMGKYAYIYSQNGMQIVMYLPTLNSVAMVGPH